DTLAVRGVQRIADLRAVLQRLIDGHRAFERHALDVFHHQVIRRLAISDVATLERSRVEWDEIRLRWKVMVRRLKTGPQVFLPIPDEVKMALDALPLPQRASADCPFFFWNGVTSKRAVVGIAERTMSAVFKRSGVKDAGTHRFRHTLATRLLG